MTYNELSILEPTDKIIYKKWNSLKGKSCIMVCHDQAIDRRILQESESLINHGYNVLILCLSLDKLDFLEKKDEIFIHRIGLSKIIPDCKIYQFYQELSRHVQKLDHISHILSKSFKLFLRLKYKLLRRAIYGNNGIGYPLPFDYAFKSTLDNYTADLIIAHDLPALKASTERAEELDIPVIYDAHEFYSEQKIFSRYQKKIMTAYEKKYIKKCADIITVNNFFIELFKKRYGIKSGHVIRNSYKLHVIKSVATLHQKINKPTDQKIILFQGGIAKDRNLINLIKGFMLLKAEDINLIFLGPQDKILVKKMKDIAGTHLDKNIFFLDPVSQEELIDYTATATFGVIPYLSCDINTKYCTPNKLFEYIQAELPILYNNKLLEVEKIMSEVGGGGIGYNMSSANNIKKALQIMLSRNLEEDKFALQKSKQDICWENESVKLIEIVNKIF